MKDSLEKSSAYKSLVTKISDSYSGAQLKAVQSINTFLLQSYWQIGQYIVEYEQGGADRAVYGNRLLVNLSKDLSLLHGKGFSPNLNNMRLVYLRFPICQKLSDKLSWSHYCELIKLEDELERSFYEKQAILENWSTTELNRQKKSGLFLRLAVSKNKEGVLKLAKEGQLIEKPIDIIRDPYILDFLKIPEPYALSESDLENRIITYLQHFLLELGKGFAFIGRQYRITINNKHHRVDLVFYHRILKCFVLIDLKKDEAGYEDIGQMNMYLGYFEKEENTHGDNPPIGIVLAHEKDELLVDYALHGITSKLFVSKYQLYLPDKEELRRVIKSQLL